MALMAMSDQTVLMRRRLDRVSQGLDEMLSMLSTYALPLLIGVASLLALFAWNNQYPVAEPRPLEIQVLRPAQANDDPGQVMALLRWLPLQSEHNHGLSEQPYWFSFAMPKLVSPVPQSVEFPSRHTTELTCWDAATLRVLGSGNRTATSGSIFPLKAGFVLEAGTALEGTQLICRTSSIGPARLSAVVWPTADLQQSAQEFHRKSGLLDGGILVLAIFVLITAWINRSGLYLLFAAWLVVNLRMGALSVGWDTQWLGHTIPHEWLLRVRLVTTALYYTLAVTLFKTLFREDLPKVGSPLLFQLAQWTCLPMLLLSTFAGYPTALLLVWFQVRILMKTRSRVAMWYGASIGVTVIATFSEVISAALGVKGVVGTVNSVTAALSSSLLAAIAIAEQMRQEHEQRLEIQAKLAHTFDAMPIGLFTLDLRGRFISANPALLGLLGKDVLAGGGTTWSQYFEEGCWTKLHQMVHDGNDETELEGRRLAGDDGVRRFLVKARLARDKIEGSLQDVTDKARAIGELHFLATHDSLTKVLNRRGSEQAIGQAVAKIGAGRTAALAYLDLDRFKLINDLFGHSAGDEVLQQICKRVSDMLSRDLQFGRVGGDEFVIVFPDTPIALAAVMCRGIVDCIGTLPYRVGEKAFYVRGSIGLIEVVEGVSFKDAISTADRACRDAKSTNSGGLVVYQRDAPAFERHEAELKLIAQLSSGTATHGLHLQMQPIMSLKAPHDSLNFEVLLRMRDADGNTVPTDRLIAAGEASGSMAVIDRWVLKSTLEWLNCNHVQMKHTKFVCMNLSGASLNDEKFLAFVYDLLEQNPHIVRQLCLEITESVALHDLDNTRRFVNKVRSYGAKVALDDFGAGYTSFSYLKEFKADLLKIDGSFIVNMNQHPANIAIVEAMCNLASNLGMMVIAEWAEDQATVETLAEIGVDYVQGFVVARPQHPDKLLTAASSASFIQDEELSQFVDLLGKPDPVRAQTELFGEADVRKVH
jgi:diguanylate cyclase (GGDEF)-like protein